MSTKVEAAVEETSIEGNRLTGEVGVMRIAAIGVATSAPLAVVAGYLAIVIALGNGLGAPLAFMFVGCVLGLFAVGYTEMARILPRAGGFYVYITAGLGRPIGLAATLIALLAYFFLAVGTYTLIGLAAEQLVRDELGGPSIPWWLFVAGALLLSTLLAYRELNVSAKVVSFLMLFEFALILSFDFTVFFSGGASGLPHEPFSPANFVSGTPGLALLFVSGMFVGFESTAVYRDEARDPEKTIPRATYLIVGFLTLFYAGTTYLLIASFGAENAIALASEDPANAFLRALGNELGQKAVIACYVLLCTSLYGAALSLHNVLSRFLFRMGENGLAPSGLSQIHPKHNAPSRASLTTGIVLALIMVPFPILGAEADLLYARQLGVGIFGFIMLLFLTSIAVIVFFLRTKVKLHPWRTIVAPVSSAMCLFLVFALSNFNFADTIGMSQFAANIVLALIYGVGIGGVLWGLWLRAKKPHVFARIGAGEQEV
jgi:amino acid transporter